MGHAEDGSGEGGGLGGDGEGPRSGGSGRGGGEREWWEGMEGEGEVVGWSGAGGVVSETVGGYYTLSGLRRERYNAAGLSSAVMWCASTNTCLGAGATLKLNPARASASYHTHP
jgi:hypothetical protein